MVKTRSVFWTIYRIILIIFVLALLVGVTAACRWMKGYEASQPKYAAEAVYERYFSKFNAEEYVELCGASSAFEEKEALADYLKGVTDGKTLSYMKVSSAGTDSVKYIVKAGDTKIASFLLTEDTSADSRFKQYKAENFELFTDSKTKVTVEAPAGYTVLLNGKAVGAEYIKESGIETESCRHMPQGVSGILMDKYVVTGLLSTPAVTATSPDGTAAEVSEVGGKYTVAPVNEKSLQSKYSEWILEATEKYAVYMQYDSTVAVMGFNQIKGYFDPSSELYEDIRTVENMFVIEYSSYEFADEKTDEFISYDENTFSCRVMFTHILHRNGADDYKDYLDLTLYLRNVDGQFLIYDMSQN